jgi:hypothetical protein
MEMDLTSSAFQDGGTLPSFFRVYASDTPVSLRPGAGKAELLQPMKGHTSPRANGWASTRGNLHLGVFLLASAGACV